MSSKPIVADPDPHYWRRRANRRVRKERLARSLKRWSVVLLALAIIGAALFQAGSFAVERLMTEGGLYVERVEIEGASQRGVEPIRDRLRHFAGMNILDVNLYEVAAAAESDPWVLSASAKRVLPGTLHVTVAERRPAAVARIGGTTYLVDATGYVVGPMKDEASGHLPLLAGLDGLGRKALAAALARGVQTIARVRRAAGVWVGEIASIDLSRRDRIDVRTVDPGPAIRLDPQRVERNLNRYLELRREIARRAGRLEYVDLRWQDRITVMPAAQNTP